MQKTIIKINMDDHEIIGPDAIEVVLHQNLKNIINELAVIVSENKLAAVSILNSQPTIVMWKNGEYVSPDPKEGSVPADVLSLHVTTSTFFWSGFTKYSGDRWTTAELDLNQL